jgi:hypothetical protein
MSQQTVTNNKTETCDYFRQATDTFKSAMESGIKFQQDAFKAVTDVFGQGESFDDCRGRMEAVATDSINLIRKNAEQSQKMFDEGCRTGLETMRKTFGACEMGNGHSNKDAMERTRDVWQSAFDAMKCNLVAAAKTSAQTIENWNAFFNKTVTACEKKAAK